MLIWQVLVTSIKYVNFTQNFNMEAMGREGEVYKITLEGSIEDIIM